MKEIQFMDNDERFFGRDGEFNFGTKEDNVDFSQTLQEREENNKRDALERYMPIGSVVKVKGNINKYMIIGFKDVSNENSTDYLACIYPYGVDKTHRIYFFNHYQIEKVYYIGYINNQEREFKKDLESKEQK